MPPFPTTAHSYDFASLRVTQQSGIVGNGHSVQQTAHAVRQGALEQ
jgi:hypothetical protein